MQHMYLYLHLHIPVLGGIIINTHFFQRKFAVYVALFALLIAQLSAFPIHTDAATATSGISLSKTSITAGYSSPVSITATASGGPTFDTIATDVKVINPSNNNVVTTASISNISIASTTSMSFTLSTGLAAGNYQFRFLKSNNTAYYANFSVVTPSITLDDSSIPSGYTSSVNLTVNGTNTNFAAGQTTVTVLDSNNASTGKAGTPSIASATSLTFSLATGLTAGTYTVQVSTPGKETVTAPLTVVTPSITLSTNSATEGYNSPISVTVTGTYTEFSGASTTVSILNSQNASAATPTNLSVATTGTSLSFSIPTGLTAGTYTIKITTGVETVSSTFTVNTASITLAEGGQALSSITEGYTTSKTITVTGTNTNFSSSTTVTLKKGTQEVTGKISGISSSSATNLSFTLATGLTEGNYTITTATNGVTASKTFNVVKPTIDSNLDTQFSKDYVSAKTITVTGTNTNFQDGVTTLELINTTTTNTVTGITSGLKVNSTTSLQFTLNTGLPIGTYKIRTNTNGIISETTETYTVTSPSVEITPSTVNSSLSSQTVTVTGTNTNFSNGVTTVQFLDSNNAAVNNITVSTPTVTSSTSLTINLTTSSALTAGNYKLRIATSNTSINETVEKSIAVAASTFVLGTSSFKEGYSETSVTVQGTGTTFSSDSAVTIKGGDSDVLITAFEAASSTQLTFTMPAGLAANADTPKSYTLDIDGVKSNFIVLAATDINVTASASQVNIGSALPLTATGTFSNNSTDNMTNKVTWSSDNETVATVSSSGLVTGIAEGTAAITADINGTSGSIEITVVDPNKPVVSGVTNGTTYNDSVTPTFNSGTATLSKDSAAATAFTSGTEISDDGVYVLTVTNSAGSTVVTFTIDTTTEPGDSTGGSGGSGGGLGGSGGGSGGLTDGGTDPAPEEPGLETELNPEEDLTITNETTADGKEVTKVAIDENNLINAFKPADADSTKVSKVTLEVADAGEVAQFELTGASLTESAKHNPQGLIEFKTSDSSYELPVNALDLNAIAKQLNTSASNLKVNVIVEKVGGEQKQKIEQKSKEAGLKLLSEAIEFRVTVEGNGKTSEISDFGKTYISRTIEVAGKLNPATATGVLIDKETGEASFVPAIFTVVDGKTKVTMKRTGNSVYSVAQFQKSFNDIQIAWAEAEIELLASKLIIKGKTDSDFKPYDNITRAEFAALLIRALGIQPETPKNTFKDVSANAWYADDIQAAYNHGLVNGRSKDTFAPNDLISRQDMATMIGTALAFAGKSNGLKAAEVDNQLKRFSDATQIKNYAKNQVALAVQLGILKGMPNGTFAPSDNANRAQAAVMLYNLLRVLEFINAK